MPRHANVKNFKGLSNGSSFCTSHSNRYTSYLYDLKTFNWAHQPSNVVKSNSTQDKKTSNSN